MGLFGVFIYLHFCKQVVVDMNGNTFISVTLRECIFVFQAIRTRGCNGKVEKYNKHTNCLEYLESVTVNEPQLANTVVCSYIHLPIDK